MSYHSLNHDQFEHVKKLIDELVACEDRHKISGKSDEFVTECRLRLARYGRNIAMSAKQTKWLEDLHAQYVRGEKPERTEQDVLDKLDRYNEADRRRRF